MNAPAAGWFPSHLGERAEPGFHDAEWRVSSVLAGTSLPSRIPARHDAEGDAMTSEPHVHHVLDSAVGYGPVTNLFAAGDPDVRFVDGRWVMYLGAAYGGGEGVNLFTAHLPVGAPLTSDSWRFDTDPDEPTRAQPLRPLPDEGAFDEWRHTPCRVVGRTPGTARGVERLYYTGTAGSHDMTERRMAIGVMERRDGRWKPLPHPIVSGDDDRPNVLEPKVVHADGRWRMWYQATHHEAGPGELPNTQIRYSESGDGITNWTEPQVVFDDDRFDAAPTSLPDGRFHLLVASAPNTLGPVAGLPPQGLWSLTTTQPAGGREHWSRTPRQLLDADAGPSWYRRGVYGPCAVVAPGASGADVLHVFFTSMADTERFRMSVGRFEVPLDALGSGRV